MRFPLTGPGVVPATPGQLANRNRVQQRRAGGGQAWQPPLRAALVTAIVLLLLALLWFTVGPLKHADISCVLEFSRVNRRSVYGLEAALVRSVDPPSSALWMCAIVAAALCRRRPLLAVVVVLTFVGAVFTTEFLKLLLPARGALFLDRPLGGAGSFPSGHTTSSMAVSLSAVLVAPPGWRGPVAAAAAVYSLTIAYSLLALGDHYPSDVIAGYLVALQWTFAAVAALRALDLRAATRPVAVAKPRRRGVRIPVSQFAITGACAALSVALQAPGQQGMALTVSATAIAATACAAAGIAAHVTSSGRLS